MIFEHIEPAPADAILGLTEAFRADDRAQKINLGVGVYQDDNGVTPVMDCVKEAEKRLVASETTKSYMPISGTPAYKAQVQQLLFGEAHGVLEDQRVRTAHTPGGTGGLRVGAELLKQLRPGATVWASSPTWANHPGVFSAAGFALKNYPYYDADRNALDFARMQETLSAVPAGDVVLLHVCCHNPTGVDLTADQWAELGKCAARQGWIPFLDFAYQGLGMDLEQDRTGLLQMAAVVPEMVVAHSFSKNFGLYRERTGSVTLMAENATAAQAVFSHLEKIIRVLYSNPPAHGGQIVQTVLADADLRAGWEKEVAAIRDRIQRVRVDLVAALKARTDKRNFSFIAQQKGMFSFSGLSDEQVQFLREKKGIYIVKGGRINVAGITPANLEYLADAIAAALTVPE